MAKKNHTDLIKGYEFWLWEYQRRNVEYRKDYDIALKKFHDAEVEGILRLRDLIHLQKVNHSLYMQNFPYRESLLDCPRTKLRTPNPLGDYKNTKDGEVNIEDFNENELDGIPQKERLILIKSYHNFVNHARDFIFENFAKVHNRHPLNYDKGITSDEIIRRIICGGFSHDLDISCYRVHRTGAAMFKYWDSIFFND